MITQPITLGLDMGGNFGYAVGQAGKIIRCGTIDVATRATQLRCSKVTAVWCFLREIIDQHEVEVVCREDSIASFKQSSLNDPESRKKDLSQALIVHAKYAGIIELLVDQKKIKMIKPVHPSTLKSWAQCGRKGGKPEMIRAANRFYDLKLLPDEADAADAAHVCAWAMHQIKLAGNSLLPAADHV